MTTFYRFNYLPIFFLIAVLPIVLAANDSLSTYSVEAERLVDSGRDLFYASVEDAAKLDSAFQIFEQLKDEYPGYSGRATTYIGALTALKGRHAFWVYSKYRLVKEGLEIMDQGVQQAPDDIEALFIYGSTCHFMPFLFGKNEDAQNAFKKILQLLPGQWHAYDRELVMNVIDFLLEHTKLTEEEQLTLQELKIKVAQE
jgi:tetratricopeptide (TPR) repeat protein